MLCAIPAERLPLDSVSAMVIPEPGVGPGNASTLAALTQTDESGRYRLQDVPPGRYYIVAGRVDFPTYFPGGTNIADARSITVVAGGVVGDIDFVFSRRACARNRLAEVR